MEATVVDCQEEVIKSKRQKACNSKFLKHLLECLRKKEHSHMLCFCNKKETQFMVTFTDKKSPLWKEQDISLFKEQDAVFPKERDKAKYELTCKQRFKANMKKLCDARYLKEVGKEELATCKYKKKYEILKFPIGDCKKEVESGSKFNKVEVNIFDFKNDIDKTWCDPVANNREDSDYPCLSGTPIYGENQAEASESHACMIRESSYQSDNVISDLQNIKGLIQPDAEVSEHIDRIISALRAVQPSNVSVLEKMESPTQPDTGVSENLAHIASGDLYAAQPNNVLVLEKMESPIQPVTGVNINLDHIIGEDLYAAQPNNLSVLEKMKSPTQLDMEISDVLAHIINETLFSDQPDNGSVLQKIESPTQPDMETSEVLSHIINETLFSDQPDNGLVLQKIESPTQPDGKLYADYPEIENASDSNNFLLYKDPPEHLDNNGFNKNMKSLANPMLSSGVEVEDMLEDQPYNHLECSSLEEEWMLKYSDVSKFKD